MRLFIALWLMSGAAFAAEGRSTVSVAAVGGGIEADGWALNAYGGWAWFGARGQWGASNRVSLLAGFDSALGLRWRPYAGLNVKVVDAQHFRLTGESSFGWLLQFGTQARRGPSVEARLRLAVPLGRWTPYLSLATQYTALFDRVVIESAAGEQTSFRYRQELSFIGTAGLAFSFSRSCGVDVGVGWPWIDAPQSVSLPMVFVGIHGGHAP